ncbi:unnamed protein product [Dicrocoelium dendriticum]|nr:unnamed protein product [Dicrocoelium dendriticum]
MADRGLHALCNIRSEYDRTGYSAESRVPARYCCFKRSNCNPHSAPGSMNFTGPRPRRAIGSKWDCSFGPESLLLYRPTILVSHPFMEYSSRLSSSSFFIWELFGIGCTHVGCRSGRGETECDCALNSSGVAVPAPPPNIFRPIQVVLQLQLETLLTESQYADPFVLKMLFKITES